MLTQAEPPVDATPPEAMWSISRVAERDKISKQAVSKKVKALIANGLFVTRNSRDQVTAINVVQYDMLRGKLDDPSKDQKPQPDAPPPNAVPAPDSYNEAMRLKGWLDVEARRLELAKQRGELVPIVGVIQSLAECAAEIVKVIERLPAQADDLAASVGRDGPHGVRVALKKLADQMRREIADALAAVASAERPTVAPGAE